MKIKHLCKIGVAFLLVVAMLLTTACSKPAEETEEAEEEEVVEETPETTEEEEPAEEEAEEEEEAPVEEEEPEEEPEPELTTDLDTAELEERMVKYFDMMLNDQHEEIYEDFSLSLKGLLDAEGLRSAWKSVTLKRGAWTETKEVFHTINEGGGVTVHIVSGFENYGMETQYIFDANGDIDGIWFFDETIKEDDSGEPFTDEQFKELIETHVDNMIAGDFAAVEADFSNGLKAGFDAAGLEKSWRELYLGEFEKHVGSQVTHLGEHQNEVVIITKFANQSLKTVFVCRDNGKIAEIWFYFM